MGLLSQKSNEYEEMRAANLAEQARAVSQAGMVDAKLKLAKDPIFLQMEAEGQKLKVYSEDIQDFDGNVHGSYTVTVDTSGALDPYKVIRVTSVGLVGSRNDPSAKYTIYGELDVSLYLRNLDPTSTDQIPNPTYFEWLLFKEGSIPSEFELP